MNCSDDHEWCVILDKEYFTFEHITLLILIGTSLFGIICNSISAFIFVFSNNSTTKFLKFLKFYSINSMISSLNVFAYSLVYFFLNRVVLKYNGQIFFKNEDTVIIHIIFYNIFVLLYTFNGVLDIFLVYERIQIYLPNLKFLRSKSAGTISFAVLLYSLVINIPVNLSRTVHQQRITIESNEPITVYYYGLRTFNYNKIFLLSILICNFTRDILSFIIEMILNVVLIVTITRFYKSRMTINVNTPSTFAFRRTDINNSKIALFMNFLSAFFHVTTFSLVILIEYVSFDVYNYVSKIFIIIFSFRQSLNFFLFLKLNKKFRRNFYVLIPNFLMNLRHKRSVNTINNNQQDTGTELVNLQNITTHL